ncbi:MAG: helix-hairpin-helix domain-containing protein [Acidimicrobiales bacterium]
MTCSRNRTPTRWVRAYRAGADAMARLDEPASAIYRRGGLPALMTLPAIGLVLGLAIADVVDTGRWHWLERLEGSVDPVAAFATIGGIGTVLAHRLHDELGIDNIEELERAANDGRLETVPGFGPQRIRSIRESLATRLRYRTASRSRAEIGEGDPTTEELLGLDAEYRHLAAEGRLPLITPRRFNPDREAWLPVLHTSRADRHYSVMFSNTARAHQLGRTNDWVVIYGESPNHRTWTVVTETQGPRAGQRVVRGR